MLYASKSEHDYGYGLYVATASATKMAGRKQDPCMFPFHLRGRTAPIDVVVVDEEGDRAADLSFSSLSSLNAFWTRSCRSWNLLFFSADVSRPREAISASSSMIVSSTFEHRGKKRFPTSTGTPNSACH